MDFILENLWDRVQVQPNGCWYWLGRKSHNGYGQFRFGKISSYRVHRFTYEINKSKIPQGLQLDHLCRNRICCNPDHLEIVTPKENIYRGFSFAGIYARRTHCKNGHAFTKENTGITKTGTRNCKMCSRNEARKFYYKKIGKTIPDQTRIYTKQKGMRKLS